MPFHLSFPLHNWSLSELLFRYGTAEVSVSLHSELHSFPLADAVNVKTDNYFSREQHLAAVQELSITGAVSHQWFLPWQKFPMLAVELFFPVSSFNNLQDASVIFTPPPHFYFINAEPFPSQLKGDFWRRNSKLASILAKTTLVLCAGIHKNHTYSPNTNSYITRS